MPLGLAHLACPLPATHGALAPSNMVASNWLLLPLVGDPVAGAMAPFVALARVEAGPLGTVVPLVPLKGDGGPQPCPLPQVLPSRQSHTTLRVGHLATLPVHYDAPYDVDHTQPLPHVVWLCGTHHLAKARGTTGPSWHGGRALWHTPLGPDKEHT